MSFSEPSRKPRPKPGPYNQPQKQAKQSQDTPKTSAKSLEKSARENLTLHDWITVFAFIDSHRDISQANVVSHFRTQQEGALLFTQSTLSQKIKDQKKLEAHIESNPMALSSKCPQVVTWPDVEEALVHWVKHMEEKGETVNGPMLHVKRERFEKQMDVPENERLTGDGWVAIFCSAYKINEFRRHGEAGSVDLAAVAAKHICVQKKFANVAPRDQWNFDESGLFPFAPPDHGLSTKQMSGKKTKKFRITVGFACNTDGSEKAPIFFIGKSKQPCCFKRITPKAHGFYYQNNKSAWMTSKFFEEWIIAFDARMRNGNQHIVLFIDNFSGHNISYKPCNIELKYFEPNLTPFVQPLDAGIIRCFKAHYWRAHCERAIKLDEAGERDIYNINLLEGMLMANAAWDAVQPSTIEHCWNHTRIQPPSYNDPPLLSTVATLSSPSSSDVQVDPGAWSIIHQFAQSDSMTQPEAEQRLEAHLGLAYIDEHWAQILKAMMSCEEDSTQAIKVVELLASQALASPTITLSLPTVLLSPDQQSIETQLIECVTELVKRKHIFGTPPTLDELVDPAEEKVIPLAIALPGDEEEIIALVRQEADIRSGKIPIGD